MRTAAGVSLAIMAAYLLASLPLIILFLFTMKLFIRGLGSGAVKG